MKIYILLCVFVNTEHIKQFETKKIHQAEYHSGEELQSGKQQKNLQSIRTR
jgi:hypothetical protein